MAEDPTNPDGRINAAQRGQLLLIGIDRPLSEQTPGGGGAGYYLYHRH